MNNLLDFDQLKVAIAGPDIIRSWSFGEITRPETINYRTLKAEKDGLFAENIFGPTKDWECYCGKYKRIRYRGVICDKCGVEVTQSKVRRERMGHITLASPVAHIWFVKGAPSKLSLILDLTMKNLEAVIYFASYLVTGIDPDKKAEAIEKLEKQLGEKQEESKKALEQTIKEAEDLTAKELKELKKKIGNDEKFELQGAEVQIEARRKIAQLKEQNQVELSQLEEIYKAVSEIAKSINPMKLLSEDEFFKLDEYGVSDFVEVKMGAEALLEVLQKTDLDKLASELRVEVSKSSGQRHIKATKRLRLVEGMRKSKISPASMVLTILPVLPPDLRPMVQLPGGRFATSDLNDLYRRVINRNNRLKRLIDLGAPEIILRNEKRMLQEAVDSLIDSSSRTTRRAGTHQLRSLSEMLRGKQGRFRQNLLGKRVDYSGRSVIIVGPKLKLSQVGLPKEMALEMFKPFVLREIISRGLASNVKGAKNVLEFRPPEVWDILEEVIKDHPVLINRAPTLHRLGIQAFFPILIDGNAIQIHPCICAGFNADFDGDQMAVHVPLSEKAKAEARDLMMAKENILRPANSSPINVPNREMALGSYFVTSIDKGLSGTETDRVYSKEEAEFAFQTDNLDLRQLIKCKIGDSIIETTVGRIIFNNFLPESLRFINETINASGISKIIMTAFKTFTKDEVAKLIDDIKEFGFWGATISGLSVGIFDNKIIPEKATLIAKGDKEIAEIEDNLKKEIITSEEKRALAQEVWTRIGDEIVRKTFASIEADNPIQVIIQSGGARATMAQIAQTAGMRGFSVDPTGKIVELPTKSNYREGLGVFEYFTSCRGARKGVADRAIRTADAGYLTRRLVDVSHDMIVRIDDCNTKNGFPLEVIHDNAASNSTRFLGRKLLGKVIDPKTKKQILPDGAYLEEPEVDILFKSEAAEVLVRAPLTCEARYGICAACYGLDLSSRKLVGLGTPVGVVAAQAIGEPGTQLTMRTFHSGGVVGIDITQGLPRVEELFEARTPKSTSPISEIAGKVSIAQTESGRVLRVRTTTKPHEEREYAVPITAELLVEDGQLISAGTQLATGHLDIKEVLRVKGLRAAQRYIVDAAKEVYESQGVHINEKHFEVIVRKMSDKVRVESQGDTVLLPGEVVNKTRFEEENTRVLAEGGEPSTAGVIVLGITRASLQTESFLSAASFVETTTVLSDAAASGKVDKLIGLKENVIIGRLIPTSPERAGMEPA